MEVIISTYQGNSITYGIRAPATKPAHRSYPLKPPLGSIAGSCLNSATLNAESQRAGVRPLTTGSLYEDLQSTGCNRSIFHGWSSQSGTVFPFVAASCCPSFLSFMSFLSFLSFLLVLPVLPWSQLPPASFVACWLSLLHPHPPIPIVHPHSPCSLPLRPSLSRFAPFFFFLSPSIHSPTLIVLVLESLLPFGTYALCLGGKTQACRFLHPVASSIHHARFGPN